jgi:L-threonylcarbamoyladenylate synthase
MQPGAFALDIPVWRVNPHHPEPEILRLAGELLSRGGVILYPTETFYGLGGDPRLPLAVERIYRIKGREFSKPLPLIAANLEAVYQAVAEWPILAERLAQAFWPGPLTLLLRAAAHILPQVHGNTGKIGLRISSHPVSQALATQAGGLLTATSANLAGQRAYRTPAEMPAEFVALVDGVVDADLSGGLENPPSVKFLAPVDEGMDAGPSGGNWGNLPSTIVDVSSSSARLVRPGCIPWERVLQVIG